MPQSAPPRADEMCRVEEAGIVRYLGQGAAWLAQSVAGERPAYGLAHAAVCAPGSLSFCLGYSAGGMVALDYGRTGVKISGIIVASALLKTAAARAPTRIAAPALILQGTQDQVSPMDVIASVVAEMDAAGNDSWATPLMHSH